MADQQASILIVDDEPQNRKLLEALLKPEGYFTLTADSILCDVKGSYDVTHFARNSVFLVLAIPCLCAAICGVRTLNPSAKYRRRIRTRPKKPSRCMRKVRFSLA